MPSSLFLAYTAADANWIISHPELITSGQVLYSGIEPHLIFKKANIAAQDITEFYHQINFPEIYLRAKSWHEKFEYILRQIGQKHTYDFSYKGIDLISCSINLLYYFFYEASIAYYLALAILTTYHPQHIWINSSPIAPTTRWGFAPLPRISYENQIWPVLRGQSVTIHPIGKLQSIEVASYTSKNRGNPYQPKEPPGDQIIHHLDSMIKSNILFALQNNFLKNYAPIGQSLTKLFPISTFDLSTGQLIQGWLNGRFVAISHQPRNLSISQASHIFGSIFQTLDSSDYCSDDSINLWPLIKSRIQLFMNDDLPEVMIWTDTSSKVLSQIKPQLLVLAEEVSLPARTLGALATNLGIPKLVIEHGAPASYDASLSTAEQQDDYWRYNYGETRADYLCVWGDYGRKQHIEKRGLLPERIFATGWPWIEQQLQKYQELLHSTPRHGLQLSKGNYVSRLKILYLSTATFKFYYYLYGTIFETLKQLRQTWSIKFVLRPHGAEDINLLHDLADQVQIDIEINNQDDLLEQIVESDIVLGGSTSVFSYAIALHKPCIYVDLLKPQDSLPYGLEQAALAVKTPDELLPAIEYYLNEPKSEQAQRWERQRRFTQQYLGPLDGKATERIATVVSRILRSQTASKHQHSEKYPSKQPLSQQQLTPMNLASPVRIDIGCGPRKAPGFIGVDIAPAPGVDIVADLGQAFPFDDSTVDELRAHDVIEHLADRIHTMNEIWRICKPGAKVDVRVPSSDGRGAFQDPTHISFWNINSFKYYCVEFPPYLELCHQYGFKGAFKLLKLDHEQSPDHVIHVNAELEVIKPIPDGGVSSTPSSQVKVPVGNLDPIERSGERISTPTSRHQETANWEASPSLLSIYTQIYQQDPDNRAVIANLRRERQRLAQEWLELDAQELESIYPASLRQVYQAFLNSGLQREPLTPTEAAFVEEQRSQLTTASDGTQYLKHFLVLSLYCRIDQIPLPSDVAMLPDWFLPDYLQLLLAMPPYYQQPGDGDRYYIHFHQAIHNIHQSIFQVRNLPSASDIITQVAKNASFISLYFNEHNLKDLYIWRSDFLEAALHQEGYAVDYKFAPRPVNRRKIRLGILANHFDEAAETFSSLTIYEYISREFDVTLYTFRFPQSTIGNYCRKCANDLKVLPPDLASQVDVIRDDDLDILFIGTNVTIGTTPICLLAVHRLARIQLTSITSITTTGFRHIDYFLSGKLTDPSPDAQSHYRERLIQLPDSVHCFSYGPGLPLSSCTISREDLGIADDCIVYISGANFFKCIPELIHTWAKIIAAVPNAVLVLLPFGPNWYGNYPKRAFIQHVTGIFNEYSVENDRILILDPKPVPNREDVKAYMAIADIYLDSYPVCGTTSLMEPLELGLAIVSRKGEQMRGAMGAAILEAMQLSDLVTDSESDYIQLATMLGTDASKRTYFQKQVQQQMNANPPVLDSQRFGTMISDVFKKLVTDYEVKILVDRLNLRSINVLVFPDWQTPEEELLESLMAVMEAIAHNPHPDTITLLIDTTGIDPEEADLALSSIAMNLMMEEDAERYESLEISLVDQLSPLQWQALLSQIRGRVVLPAENEGAIEGAKAGELPRFSLDDIGRLGEG